MMQSSIRIMFELIKLIKPLMITMVICISFGVLGFFCASAVTVLGGELVLNVMGEGLLGISFKTVGVLIIACALGRGIFRYIEQACGHYIAFKVLAVIRDKVFGTLRRLTPAKLETKDKGNLITLITSDIELLEVFYAHTIAPIVIAIIVSVTVSITIGRFNIILGILAMFSYILVGCIIPICLWDKENNDGTEIRDRLGNLNSFFLEGVRGIKDTNQYNDGEDKLRDIISKTHEINRFKNRLKVVEGRGMSVSNSAISICTVLMVVLNVYLNTDFKTTLITTLLLSSSFGASLALSKLTASLPTTIAAGDRVLKLLKEEEKTPDIINGKEPIFKEVGINNIDFSYDKTSILKNISMSIKKNEIATITGENGCGKSTILKLIMRFWSATNGEIKISDSNIEDISTKHLRNVQSYMTQQTDIFTGTIKENILIARKDASLDEVIEAARKASIHEFIMSLPNQYDTEIGELGSNLSDGEKQRIGLARVFLHNGDLVLLDEPTANLDSLNEAMIMKSIKKFSREKAVILVSHNMSNLGFVDKNYHLNNR